MPGLRVVVRSLFGRRLAATTTASDGSFQFLALKLRHYQIQADDDETAKGSPAVKGVVSWVRLTKQAPDLDLHLEGPIFDIPGDGDASLDMTSTAQGLTISTRDTTALPLR